MDTSIGNTTRDKLIETAKELFLTKGVDRVGVREIATKAGINLSLMNYYFRSKEKLFETIFENVISDKAVALRQILDSELPVEEKIKRYVNTYIDILVTDPLHVSFVLSVVHRNYDNVGKMKGIANLYNTEKFIAQLKHENEKGNIRPVDPEQIFISMISLILFPLAIKPLIMERNKFDDKAMEKFILDRKDVVYKMLMDSIKI
mgnify:CR=1 FL=1